MVKWFLGTDCEIVLFLSESNNMDLSDEYIFLKSHRYLGWKSWFEDST